ncbi:MAG TPA: GTPase RsgA, partial [Candidatus Thermoplasmatota archaeon]|nr:GTPase RsgA [Candidatus Thermoplasmatota archaeon]
SSGVGKSTLVNALVGETRLRTQDVRDDGRGRHTTTRRELLALPWGARLIDTPGLREVQLWGDASAAFGDVAALAASCRFSDCGHGPEPGCAVRGAVDPARLASWRKLQAEAARTQARAADRRAQMRSWGRMHRGVLDAKRMRREEW